MLFVSAGSTGAFVVGASLIVKRIKGIKRAALAPVIPTVEGRYMLIDCRANAECRPEMLVQFGLMGSAYMNKIMSVNSPRVALINNGTEEHKGAPLQQGGLSAAERLSAAFCRNIEARQLPLGGCDVRSVRWFYRKHCVEIDRGPQQGADRSGQEYPYENTMTKLAALTLKGGLGSLKRRWIIKSTAAPRFWAFQAHDQGPWQF